MNEAAMRHKSHTMDEPISLRDICRVFSANRSVGIVLSLAIISNRQQRERDAHGQAAAMRRGSLSHSKDATPRI
jgi:hypothetical protein